MERNIICFRSAGMSTFIVSKNAQAENMVWSLLAIETLAGEKVRR